MSSDTRAISMDSVRGLPPAARVNVAGLVLTAAGMLLQIAAGSMLYSSLAGPIVLVVAAIFVTFGPGRWTPWVGLVGPLVLGFGAIVAAVMTGGFIDQLTAFGMPLLVVGSLMHVVGLITAIAGGLRMIANRGWAAGRER